MSNLGEIGEVREGGMRSEGIIDSVEWSIPSFSSLRAGEGDRYDSPPFYAFDRKWILLIYPKGIKSSRREFVEVFLIRYYVSRPVPLKATLSIKRAGGEERGRERRMEFSDDDYECVWSRFCERSKLEREGWMEGGSLTLSLRMERVLPAQAGVSTDKRKNSDREEANIKKKFKVKENSVCVDQCVQVSQEVSPDVETLASDIFNLLKDEILPDFTLKCGGRDFSVHRCVLAARSDVFRAMMLNRMKEGESGSADIKELEASVLESLLKFLYSGKLEDASEGTIIKLYEAADLYAVHSLRRACSSWMVRNLTRNNCLPLLFIADSHSDPELKAAAVSFVLDNKGLFKSEVWLAFSKKHPVLANEVFQSYFSSDQSNK